MILYFFIEFEETTGWEGGEILLSPDHLAAKREIGPESCEKKNNQSSTLELERRREKSLNRTFAKLTNS